MTKDIVKEELINSTHCVVLLVDDQPMVAEAIRRMLVEESDIDFHYCSESSDALTQACKLKPTVILQDLVMPDIDGMELLNIYRENSITKDIPVIVLSTKEEPMDKSNAFSAGANDYLVKLPDQIELKARIRAHSKSYLTQLQRDEAFKDLREVRRQLELSNERLQRLSSLDSLTGIANRRHLDNYLTQEWLRAAREGVAISLVMIDIDYFKAYNDNYGHQAGDACLQKISAILREVTQRPGDLAARYGGDEFVIILPRTELDGAKVIIDTLFEYLKKLRLQNEFSKIGNCVTLSAGVATVKPAKGKQPEYLIGLADKSMYSAKKAGRNCYKVADITSL